MKISLETTTIKETPGLTLSPASGDASPAVFFIPGYGGTKEVGLPLGHGRNPAQPADNEGRHVECDQLMVLGFRGGLSTRFR
ncbi:MAG: hypothetical protein U9R72_13905 [Chloroflexota bacterium]|nr:hypothetical protein [Chloroflexota bacterium]